MSNKPYKLSELLSAIERYRPAKGLDMMQAEFAEKIRIGYSAATIGQSFHKKSEKEAAYFLKRLAKALNTETDFRKRLLLRNVGLRCQLNYSNFLGTVHDALAAPLNLAELHATWHSLYVTRFTGMHAFNPEQWRKTEYLLRRFYNRVFETAKAAMIDASKPIPQLRDGKKRILIATNEYRLGQHPIAQQALQLAQGYKAEENTEIKIVNCSTPPRLPVGYFHDHTFAEVDDALVRAQHVMAGPHKIAFTQNPYPIMSSQSLRWMDDVVCDFAPDAIVTVGPGNILADIYSYSLPVVAFPNTHELPFSLARQLITIAAPDAAGKILLKRAGVDEGRYKKIQTAFQLPPTGPSVTRAQAGLEEDDFVFVLIGMRLPTECTDCFKGTLQTIAAQSERAKFVFVGALDRRLRWLDKFPLLKERSRLLGHQEDVLAFLDMADAYINPPRQGGGTSAAYALAKSLPILTLHGGDVANVAGPSFGQINRDEIIDEAKRLINNPVYCKAQSQAALERWTEKSDLKAMCDAVWTVVETAEQQRSPAWQQVA